MSTLIAIVGGTTDRIAVHVPSLFAHTDTGVCLCAACETERDARARFDSARIANCNCWPGLRCKWCDDHTDENGQWLYATGGK